MKAFSKKTPCAWLFVPGDNAHKIEKALATDADALIFDLEDAVAIPEKENARNCLRESLKRQSDKFLTVRINACDTPYFETDIALALELGLQAIMLPKCENAAAIECVRAHAKDIAILPLIESAAGVVHFSEIAQADIIGAAFGSVDFALDLGVAWSDGGEERRYAMEKIALESHAFHLQPPIGAVYPDVQNREGFNRETTRERQLGFHGKMLIHPTQINWVHELYRTSEEEIAWSRRVVEAYENSSAGAVALDGKMIDLPMYRRAKNVLDSQVLMCTDSSGHEIL